MKLHVDLKENGYDILMEHGILYRLNDYIDLNRKVMIVTDSGVPEAYANIVREQCKKGYVHVIEQGEDSKDLAVFKEINEDLLAHKFSRKDCVVALGGGVVGDLAGYVAERYDVEADECKKRAKKRAKASIKRELRDTVKGYSIVKPVSDNVKIQKASQKYALYPVWILNTTWRDQKYVFAMNGQTGKMVGDLPADKGAFWKYVVSRGLVIGVILYALMWLTVLI